MATTRLTTGSAARERSRLAYGPARAPLRIVAPGGPVSAAIAAGRGKAADTDRDQLRGLAGRIRLRLDLDAVRIDRCLAAAAVRADLREDGGCA